MQRRGCRLRRLRMRLFLALAQSARVHWGALDAARRERFRFLHVSTDEVFGSLGETGAFDEATPDTAVAPGHVPLTNPVSPAAATTWPEPTPALVNRCADNFTRAETANG